MDSELKKAFDALCMKFGLSSNAAMNVFARAVVQRGKIPFDIVSDKVAHYVTDEDYEADESRGIKPDVDDFTTIQHRKKSDHNRKTFSSHSRLNPLFLIKFQFDFQP